MRPMRYYDLGVGGRASAWWIVGEEKIKTPRRPKTRTLKVGWPDSVERKRKANGQPPFFRPGNRPSGQVECPVCRAILIISTGAIKMKCRSCGTFYVISEWLDGCPVIISQAEEPGQDAKEA